VNSVSAEAARELILRDLAEQLEVFGLVSDQVPDDFDLIATGVIDSFGLLQLIASLEEAFGVEIELELLDADLITVIGPLCRHIAATCTPTACLEPE
jgi:acyl carrier protein